MTSENTRQRPLTERRQARTENSRAAQSAFWGARFDDAATPVDLLQAAYRMLRARVVRLERKALRAEQRARTPAETEEARRQTAAVRERITVACAVAAAELERLANTIDTTRR